MPERITPDTTRRGEIPARPVRLSDGRDWGFSRPTVRLSPRVVRGFDQLGRPVERVTAETGFGYPPGVQSLIDGVRSACQRGSVVEQHEAFFTLAACLLLRAHEVSHGAAWKLLSVSEDELPRLVREVMAVVGEADQMPKGNRVEVPTVE